MDIRELMIGDWVLIDHCSGRLEPCYGRITGIDRNGEDVYTTEGMVDVSLIRPARLTRRILELNGFRRCSDEFTGLVYYVLEIGRDDGDSDILFVHCLSADYWQVEYNPFERKGHILNTLPGGHVHELQHAIRQGGICEDLTKRIF